MYRVGFYRDQILPLHLPCLASSQLLPRCSRFSSESGKIDIYTRLPLFLPDSSFLSLLFLPVSLSPRDTDRATTATARSGAPLPPLPRYPSFPSLRHEQGGGGRVATAPPALSRWRRACADGAACRRRAIASAAARKPLPLSHPPRDLLNASSRRAMRARPFGETLGMAKP